MNAPVTPLRTEAENALAAAFGAARSFLAGGPAVMRERDEAFAAFMRSGLPHRRVEAWHFTDLRAALREILPLAEAPLAATIAASRQCLDIQAPRPAGLDTIRLVLVDGSYVPELSDAAKLPAGVVLRPLAEVLAKDEPFALDTMSKELPGSDDSALALNTAFANGGFVIEVAAGARIVTPIEIFSIAGAPRPHSFFVRSLVRLGPGAALTLIESHASAPGLVAQENDALIVDLAEGAEIEHVATFASDAAAGIHVSTFSATLAARARLTSFALVGGAGLLRRQGFLRFEGTHAKASLAGVGLLRGKQHADTTLVVEHVAPHCESREYFKHIVDGAATGVFQGKIVVAPGAQKTDGLMKSHAILLSDDATMDNKPELEIFADDVQCGHGATCGELDADQIFYVQSRGLPRPEAEALLLEAFAAEAIDHVASAPLGDMLRSRVQAWLGERGL
jgi:Fe-S cluster assembly protein SufD